MVNLAEELHRERRRRERALGGEAPLARLVRDARVRRPPRCSTSSRFGSSSPRTRPKFAPHDEREARRDRRAAARDRRARADRRRRRRRSKPELRAQIVLLWQSNELYRTAPTVADEVRNLWRAFASRSSTKRRCSSSGSKRSSAREVPTFLSFGSWIGSDRDGNANVAPDAMLARTRARASASCCERTIRRRSKTLQVRFSQDARARTRSRRNWSRRSSATRANSPTCATRSGRVRRPSRTAASSRSSTAA